MYHPPRTLRHALGSSRSSGLIRLVALAQGVYFLITGVWPLVSMRTFEKVTGPKAAHWLVNTVGVLVAVIGVVLALAGARKRTTTEVALLGAGSAVGLATIDVIYVARGRIRPVYLLDAVLEGMLVAAWALAWPALDEP